MEDGETAMLELGLFHFGAEKFPDDDRLFCIRFLPSEDVEVVPGNVIWLEDFLSEDWEYDYSTMNDDFETYPHMPLAIDSSVFKAERDEVRMELALVDRDDPFNPDQWYSARQFRYVRKEGYISFSHWETGAEMNLDQFLAENAQ